MFVYNAIAGCSRLSVSDVGTIDGKHGQATSGIIRPPTLFRPSPLTESLEQTISANNPSFFLCLQVSDPATDEKLR